MARESVIPIFWDNLVKKLRGGAPLTAPHGLFSMLLIC